jgi:type II secretory pathway pseudopilin PulG
MLARSGGRRDSRWERGEAGFALMELVVSFLVIAAVVATVVVAFGGTTAKSAEAACDANAQKVESAIAMYNIETGGTPIVTLRGLTTGANPILKSLGPTNLYKFSIVNGQLFVASPGAASPVAFDKFDSCLATKDLQAASN